MSDSKLVLPVTKAKIAMPHEVEQHEWSESICFISYGVRVGIRANRKGVLKQVQSHLPPGWKPSKLRRVDRLYSFLIGVKEGIGKRRRLNLLYADDNRIAGTRT